MQITSNLINHLFQVSGKHTLGNLYVEYLLQNSETKRIPHFR